MGNRTNLYVVCLVLFPLAFAGFVVGFGCPVWQATSDINFGLWQNCSSVFESCSTFDFDDGGDWMIGVRAVEIFALVMLTVAAADIIYENCCTSFRGRTLSERVAPGILCILGGAGGVAGIIVYAIKTKDSMGSDTSYGWALALVAAGGGLAIIVGVGFCVSGFFLEKKKEDKPKGQINGRAPHLTSNEENYQMSYTNKGLQPDDLGRSQTDNLPGFAVYNGLLNRPGQRNSLPLGASSAGALPAYAGNGSSKGHQYYSISDDRVLDPGYDLSEGYLPPSRARPYARSDADAPYYGGRREPQEDPYSRGGDPYSRGGRVPEDPYSRGARVPEDAYSRPYRPAPRAGYNDPYGFDRRMDIPRPMGAGGGGGRAVGYDNRDSFYKPGRF